MTQWIRWWGLGVFVAIVLIWWLCIDLLLKTIIETAGTKVLGAKVELDNAELHLVPVSLTLSGLQLTDPDSPMTNLIEAKKINTTLDSFHLLGQKVIADNMAVTGLQFNTARKTSGAIQDTPQEEEKSTDSDGLSIGGPIPGLSLPNVDDLVDKEKVKIEKEYDKINSDLKDLENQWEKRLDELPDKDKIAEYKKRIKDIKKGNFLKQIAELKSLKKDIDRDRKNIAALNDQLKNDLDTVKNNIDKAVNLPEKHINNVLAELGLGDDALGDLATSIMSGQLKQWLEQGLAFLKSDSEEKTSEEEQVNERGEGIWVHFGEDEVLPTALIRKASLDGKVVAVGQTINFSGSAKDITHEPKQWNKPATITINGSSDQNTQLIANGVFDHRTLQGNDKVDFKLTNLPLKNYSLSSEDKLSVLAENALANIDGKLLLKENIIDLDVSSKFREVNLQVSTSNPTTITSAMVDTLKNVKHFDLILRLTGPIQKPDIKVKSDLNKLLSNAVGKGIKNETAKLRTKMSTQLKSKLAPKLNQINQQGGALTSIEEKLSGRQSELKKLIKNI